MLHFTLAFNKLPADKLRHVVVVVIDKLRCRWNWSWERVLRFQKRLARWNLRTTATNARCAGTFLLRGEDFADSPGVLCNIRCGDLTIYSYVKFHMACLTKIKHNFTYSKGGNLIQCHLIRRSLETKIGQRPYLQHGATSLLWNNLHQLRLSGLFAINLVTY